MKIFFVCLSLIALLFSCSTGNLNETKQISDTTTVGSTLDSSEKHITSTEVKTYQDSLGWGYDIYLNGQKLIHQPTIPAISGNQGFTNEEEAIKVGELMVYKIKNNSMPPSVTVQELDSLKIKYKK